MPDLFDEIKPGYAKRTEPVLPQPQCMDATLITNYRLVLKQYTNGEYHSVHRTFESVKAAVDDPLYAWRLDLLDLDRDVIYEEVASMCDGKGWEFDEDVWLCEKLVPSPFPMLIEQEQA